jgi:hypothetical protein
VADALIEYVPMEAGLEFRPVVRLDLFDLERQS